MTIVDSPGLIDLFPSKTAKQTIDNDVYQWFIDRSDVIYIVIDVSQLHLSSSLRVLLNWKVNLGSWYDCDIFLRTISQMI